MKHIRSIAIVAALIVAVGAVVAIKQSKKTTEAASPPDNLTVAGVGLSPAALGAKGDDPGAKPASTKPATVVPPSWPISQPAKPGAIQALPKLVDLGAGKCIPCKMMAPILEDLKKTHADKFEVQFIDVWRNPDEARKFNIRVIPTQIFFAPDGKELFRHEGFYGKEDILAKWKEMGF